MRTLIKPILLLVFMLALALPIFAQDNGGQFWVQAFEDRNGNGQHDPGEPFLTSGVSVNLLNSSGVVMASGDLDNAPYASQGYIGFLYLAPGDYTAVITSGNLTATTPDHVKVTITQGEAPVKVMFGAETASALQAAQTTGSAAPAAISAAPTLWNSQIARVALSGFGAVVVIGIMMVIGIGIYMVILRPRAPRDVRRTTTGSMRPVRVDQTGEMRRTGTGEIRATTTDDINES